MSPLWGVSSIFPYCKILREVTLVSLLTLSSQHAYFPSLITVLHHAVCHFKSGMALRAFQKQDQYDVSHSK